jgi:SpoVK/Ycf46/Vps4 family AAA+-type ATPase
MSLSDDEFDELLQAQRANPSSVALKQALWAAADTNLRKTVLKALQLERPDAGSDRQPASARATAGPARAADDPKVISLAQRRGAAGLSSTPELGLTDVGGLEAVKTQLRRKLLDPLKHPGLFQKFKRRSGGGILLYGPPGCGKTMVVKAVASEAGLRLIRVEAADVLDCAVGVSEKKLAASFAEARMSKPCILFFDEIEALAARRSTGSDFRAGLVSSFLTAFDGLAEQNEGILVIAATNTPWAVDTAFRRPGRFDRTLFVPPPDRSAREAILRSLLAQRPACEDVAVAEIAAATSGFSGADLVNLVETGIDLAIEECIRLDAEERLAMRHLLDAREEIEPTTLEWLATARNYARYADEGGTYKEVLAFLDRHAA